MKTLGRNADNDLYLEAGGLAILHDADAQCAVIESVLQTQRGELQFDEDGGIDYFGTVLQNPRYIDFWAGQVQSRVEALSFVMSVEDFQYRFDRETSTLYWSMTVITTDNVRLDLQNKKTVIEGRPGIDVDWSNVYDKPAGIDETLEMVADMRDEAQDLNELDARSTLTTVKDTLNRVVFDPNNKKYAESRQIKFKFAGVPLGTVIDFSNLSFGLQNTGTATEERYVPFTVEISDGTKRRNLTNMNGSALNAETNDVWFVDENAKPDGEGHFPPTQRHTIMVGGTMEITIRGNITSIKSQNDEKPIFLRSDGTPFPYLVGFTVGSRIPLETIGSGAFCGLKNLQTIVWNEPDNSTYNITFGDRAFEGCESLTGLSWLPYRLKTMGNRCFKSCKGILSLASSIKTNNNTTYIRGLSTTLVEGIPESAFEGCTSLGSVEYLPPSLVALGNRSFADCTSLLDIDALPDTIQSIGDECFEGCSGMQKILYMPTSLNTIGTGSFRGCTSLRSLFIPNTVANIGSEAFAGNTALTNVLCERVNAPTIDETTFDQESLDIYVPEGSLAQYKEANGWKKYWDSESDTGTIYEYGKAEFRLDNVPSGTILLGNTSEIVSSSIWSVEYCGTGERPRRFESTTTALPTYAFDVQPNYNNVAGTALVVITGYIRSMSAFSEAYPMLATAENSNPYLTSISLKLSSSLNTIGDYAFAQCTNLATISSDESDNPFRLGNSAFWGCSALDSMEWLNCYPNLGILEQPEDEERAYYPAFGDRCFYESGITAISYPSAHVEELPPYCFAKTRIANLEGIKSSVLNSLGEHCFEGCESLTTISDLRDTRVTKIPAYGFAGCTSLASLDGVDNISEMEENAFNGCVSLSTIGNLYQATNLTALPAHCFEKCTGLQDLNGIERISELGEYAFYGCSGLTTLNRIELSPIDTIPAYCFANCTGLTILVGCYYIKNIGEGAFFGCTGLLAPSGLGASIVSIGASAFQNCTGLKFFSCIAQTVPSVSPTAFNGVPEIARTLYVRDGMESAFSNDANWKAAFRTVLSRTIRIRYENIGGTTPDAVNINSDSVASTTVKGLIVDGDNAIPGVWFVDYGDGSELVKRYDTEKLLPHTYSARGGYDVTLFGDIVEVKGADETYSETAHGDPESVTVSSFLYPLGRYASSVSISSPYLSKIGDFCFNGYGRTNGNLEVSITMEDSGTIGAYAFAKTVGILGDMSVCNAAIVEPYAFYKSGLTSSAAFVSIVETKTGAFAYNENLLDLLGFSSLNTIGEKTFEGCIALSTTTGLSSTETIGKSAFAGCTGLTTVRDFGGGLTKIEESAFAGCNNIATIFMALENPPTSNGRLWNDGGTLAENVFESAVFENAILYVPVGAEANYANTPAWNRFDTQVDGQSRIRSRSVIFTFKNIVANDTIPNGICLVTSTGSWTISYGSQQTKTFTAGTDIPVPEYVFNSPDTANGQIEIKISGAVTAIKGVVKNRDTNQSGTQSIFGDTVGRKLVSISSSSAMEISTIGEGAFWNCSSLETVKTMPSVQTIGYGVFQGATSLSDISGLSEVVEIDAYAFSGCSSLKSLYGLSKVSTIGEYAFNGCGVKTIDALGTGISSIGAFAFRGCSLNEVQMFAENPPTIAATTFDETVFLSAPLYVRTKVIPEYSSADVWSRFANIRSRYLEFSLVGCPSNLTVAGEVGKIQSNTYWVVDWDSYDSDGQESRSGENHYLPEHVYTLSGNHTFRIEGAVTSIGTDKDSVEVTINEPNGENVIKGKSFISLMLNGESIPEDDHQLSRVVRSSYAPLATVGEAAFLHNRNLVAANLAGITKVDKAAFAFTSIEDLVLLESVADIGDYAFYGCNGFHNVTNLGGETLEIGEYSFGRIGTPEEPLKYIQISVPEANNAHIVSRSVGEGGRETSFGYFATPEDQNMVSVYVPMGSIASYTQDVDSNPWRFFNIASQVIEFTLENVPSGTTIVGLSASDTVGTARVEAESAWTIDWGDGTRSSMSAQDTTFPAHIYEYTEENKDYWETRVVDGVSSRVLTSIVISISGSIRFLGCQSANDYPMIATARGSNPYLTKVVASESMESLETIGDYAFRGCGNLTSVGGFVNVGSIGRYAFQGCTNLVGVGNADSGFVNATSIGNQAFADCTSLASLAAFPKVLTIGIRAFANCLSLSGTEGLGSAYAELSMAECPNATFAAYAFEGCDFGFIDMTSYAKPPSIQNTTFSGNPSDVIVEVQPASLEAYQIAPVWQRYWENIIASAPITITFGAGQITAGKAIYGGNGRIAFENSYVVIDWGDGTTTKSTTESSDPDNGWVFPNHIYAADFASTGAVTVRIRGKITKMWSYDATKPFIALTGSDTRIETDETTGATTTVTEISGAIVTDSNISSISFGQGSFLQSVGEGSFIGCNIGSVYFGKPAGDISIAIGRNAFKDCTYTSSITADEGAISEVGEAAFKGCTLLNSVDFLTEGCQSIGVSAFEGCSAIAEINLPSTLLSVCEKAFEGCSGILSGINWKESADAEILSNTTISIGSRAFYGCTGINNEEWKIRIPAQVKSIGAWAFYGCGEKEVRLPSTLTSIFDYAFADNKNLTSINWEVGGEVPETVGQGLFEGCSSLATVVSFGNVESIPPYCFFLCRSLSDISAVIEKAVDIGQYCFAGCTSISGEVVLPDTLETLGEGCFNCSSERFLRGVYDPEETEYPTTAGSSYLSISEFDEWMSDRYPYNRNDIWKEYDAIINSVGYDNTTFRLVWPDDNNSVLSLVGDGCFMNCTRLVSSYMPKNGITKIPPYCFYNCNHITSGNGLDFLPHSIETFGKFALARTDIVRLSRESSREVISATLAPALFFMCTGLGTLGDVSSGLVQIFSPTPSQIPDACFYGCSSLSDISALNVAVPAARLGNFCFYGCSGLTNSEGSSLADGLMSVGDYCFSNCARLLKMPQFPASDVTMGIGVFKNCTSMQSCIGLPNVDTLPEGTFSGCSSLTTLQSTTRPFPSSIENLGQNCFMGCSSLGDDGIEILGLHVHSIGISCFEGCSGLHSFPGLPYVYNYPERCFYGCTELVNINSLSSSGDTVEFSPSYAMTDNISEQIQIKFYPRQIGIEYGWCINSFTLRTRSSWQETANTWRQGTYVYRLDIYDGSTRIDFSNTMTVTQPNTDYTFTFSSNRFSAYANKAYTMKVVCVSTTTGYTGIGLALNNTASVEPGLYILGSTTSGWLMPLWSISYALVAVPILGIKAFGGCSKIKNINLGAYNTVVQVISGDEEGDPFDSIPLKADTTKKNAAIYVPEALIGAEGVPDTYKGDEYWSKFYYIKKAEQYTPEPIVVNPYVAMNVVVPAEGGSLYLTGTIDIAIGGEAEISWGDGATSTLERDYTGVVSHEYASSQTARTLRVTITGSVNGVSGRYIMDDPLDSTRFICRPLFSTVSPNTDEESSNTMATSVTFGEQISGIGIACFANCPNLTTVTIESSSVTSIGSLAFYGCSELSTIAAANNLSTLQTIGDAAFAYSGVENLNFILQASRLTSLGYQCFGRCSRLSSIAALPNSVTTLGGTKSIGPANNSGRCFMRCTALTSLQGLDGLSSSFTKLPSATFIGCTSLASLDFLPPGLTTIGDWCFAECRGITTFIKSGNTSYLPLTCINIETAAFSSCTGLTTIRGLHDSTELGAETFRRCSSLVTLEGMPAVSTLPERCFSACTGLTTLHGMNSAVTTMLAGCFSGCTSLGSDLTYPNLKGISQQISTLPANCFEGCTSLMGLDGLGAVVSFGDACFKGCSAMATIADMPTQVASLGSNCFEGCTSLTDLNGISASSLTSLPAYCFSGCVGLGATAGVTALSGMGNDITTLGAHCFSGCSNGNFTDLRSISTGLTLMGEGCFAGCSSLTDLTGLENCMGLTALPTQGFQNCSSLEQIVYNPGVGLGSNIITIGSECFDGCSSLVYIRVSRYVEGDDYEITELGSNVFGDVATSPVYQNATVYVPSGSEEAYQGATGWSDFVNFQPY